MVNNRNYDLLLAEILLDFPSLLVLCRPLKPPLLGFPPRPALDGSKLSVDSFVFCFERCPIPPKPYFLSRTERGMLLPFEALPRLAGRSDIASSTATSNSSSFSRQLACI